jgi:hypothetical protein
LTRLANQQTQSSNQVSKLLYYPAEKQVMKQVGELLTQSAVRTNPALCAAKEKEGVFILEKEQAIVD